MVMHKCVTQALARSVDPRAHLNEINWEVMSERLLSGEDIKMLWYYIRKEVRALHQAGLLQGAAYLFSYSNFSPFLPSVLPLLHPFFSSPPFFPSSSPLLLPPPPLSLSCTFQYPDNTPLPEIAASLLPYARLTVDQFVREDIKLKVRFTL